MTEAAVLYEVEDAIATVTLNRPDNRNSMTRDVLEGLGDAVRKICDDKSVRCAIITGRGKSFCAGADFKDQPAVDDNAPVLQPHERSYAIYQNFLSLLEIEVPVIAAMQGHAIGGGLGLAVVCDLRVANCDARYGANFVRLGLHPGMSMTYAGLVHYAVDRDQVIEKARELAREIAGAAPLAVRWTKRSIYNGLDWNPARAAEHEAHAQSRSMETEDFREGISALLSRREPKFVGK
ncbi:MAG: enoyl-CoA hydratase/isomerase family protein [Deltaproteobacteria bacterium]|nr:enoyl-CoA hydratase/isomerase family protein [Deltaproteobacteria bacterium]